MRIILEGPDGAGKSTLAGQLGDHFKYVHHGLYPDDDGTDLLKRYTRSLLGNEHAVFDRCFWSEQIYGEVMRGKDRLGELGCVLLTRLTRALGVSEAVCLPPLEIAQGNWAAKTEDYVKKKEQLKHVWLGYEYLLINFPHLVPYDYTWQAGGQRGLLKIEATKRKLWEGPAWLPDGCLGSPEARFLIVGERVNPKRYWVDLPFYALDGVSHYLYDVLKKTGVWEEELAFVNAENVAGEPNSLGNVLAKLPNLERIIALGEVASEWVYDQNDLGSRIKLPHPNYWVRFHFNERRKYVKMFQEAFNGGSELLRGVAGVATRRLPVGRRGGTPRHEDKRAVASATNGPRLVKQRARSPRPRPQL